MNLFRAPQESLVDIDADVAARIIGAAADIALVVDSDGVICDIAVQRSDLSLDLEGSGNWFGRPWAETVTDDSKEKVGDMLQEADAATSSRWRQLNHPSSRGTDIPILYSAIKVPRANRFVVVGRDLRPIAALQERLVAAQMAMERDYSRLRHVETRYRMLFQASAEAVLVVDAGGAAGQHVVEANPAAHRLLDEAPRRLIGRSFPDVLGIEDGQSLRTLLASARAGLPVEGLRVQLGGAGRAALIAASLFRENAALFLLVRILPVEQAIEGPSQKGALQLQLLEGAPDGFVMTDRDGRIRSANAAFLGMVQLSSEEQVRGELIDRWFGRSGVDFSVLVANLRQHGSVRMFATTLRGEYGGAVQVEISGSTFTKEEEPAYGFVIRNVDLRIRPAKDLSAGLPRSVEQLTDLVGRSPLKELVREATDVIERLCMETALKLTGDNRASAAEMLGLSRQSFYVKLRRYNMLAPGNDDEGTD